MKPMKRALLPALVLSAFALTTLGAAHWGWQSGTRLAKEHERTHAPGAAPPP